MFVAMVDGSRVTMLGPVTVTDSMGAMMVKVKIIAIERTVYSRKVVDGCGSRL